MCFQRPHGHDSLITTWQRMDTPRDVVYVFTRVYVHVCAYVHAYVCVHVCTCMMRETKLPFQDNAISQCHMHLIYVSIFVIFYHMRLCFSVLSV